jgi:hypothetical protein
MQILGAIVLVCGYWAGDADAVRFADYSFRTPRD